MRNIHSTKKNRLHLAVAHEIFSKHAAKVIFVLDTPCIALVNLHVDMLPVHIYVAAVLFQFKSMVVLTATALPTEIPLPMYQFRFNNLFSRASENVQLPFSAWLVFNTIL